MLHYFFMSNNKKANFSSHTNITWLALSPKYMYHLSLQSWTPVAGSKFLAKWSSDNLLGILLSVLLCLLEWMGRVAARRIAPKLPRAIRAGPNEGRKNPGVYPINLHKLPISPPLVWSCPDGARQLGHDVPCRRPPNPPLQSLVNYCFSQTFELFFSKKKRERESPRGWSVVKFRESEGKIRWNGLYPFHEIIWVTLISLD